MALHDFHFDGITHRERSTLVCPRARVRVSGMIDQVEDIYWRILRFNPFDEILNFPYEGVATTHENVSASNVILKTSGETIR